MTAEGPIETNPADLPATFTAPADPPSQAMAAGIAAFNERRFFEAHEYFEETWIPEEGPLADLYQGLVMLAAGFHHLTVRREIAGVERLLRTGIEQAARCGPVCQGLDIERLCREAAAARDLALDLGGPRLHAFPHARIPRIHFARVSA
jgi:hypothetical protein